MSAASPEKPQDLPKGSPFWQFSLQLYRRPGVADACLVLQEDSGVDVNVMLFLLWQASQRRQLGDADVIEVEARVGTWRETAVASLRSIRRALKDAPPTLLSGPAVEAFRNRVKAVELEAERLQQEAMYALAGAGLNGSPVDSADAAARANLAAYERVQKRAFKPGAVDAIFGGFDALGPFPG